MGAGGAGCSQTMEQRDCVSPTCAGGLGSERDGRKALSVTMTAGGVSALYRSCAVSGGVL